jgi:hypothetical protein
VYTESELHTFIPYLSSALIAAGVGSTKIAMPEDTGWNSLNYTVMNDPNTAAMVGIVTNHGYSTSSISPLPSDYLQGKPAWQTEYSSLGDAYDGSIGNGITWATSIHKYVVSANANAWHYWQSLWPRAWGAPADNQALTDASGNMAKRGYALGQWAKFVRPGYQRIDVTNSTSVLVSAFAQPTSHNWVVVAVNGSGSASTQTFAVTGAQASTAVPWITSSTLSLAQQSAVAVSSGTFSYTLPANSIVSFVGNESIVTPTRTPTRTPISAPSATAVQSATSTFTSSTTPTATPVTTGSTCQNLAIPVDTDDHSYAVCSAGGGCGAHWLSGSGGVANFGEYYANYLAFSMFRFTLSVSIPAGATIDTATLSLYALSTDGALDATYRITADKVADAATHRGSTDPPGCTGGTTQTTAYTDWKPSAWTASTRYTSPALTSIFQELVNSAGGLSGNKHVKLWMRRSSIVGTQRQLGVKDYGDSGHGGLGANTANLAICWHASG